MVRSVELPYPPVSPKYPREVSNGRQKEDILVISLTPQSVLDNLGPHYVPTSSGSPYHIHCVPRPLTIPHLKPTYNLTHPPPSQPSHLHTHKSQAHKTTAISVRVPQPKGATIHVKPQTSYSNPVRKLLFESHGKRLLPFSKA